mmetsp:Transcript_34385/g.79854  ORF Transcript_34385/g.79854 Transcript_34385/m.79854 type:complete len:104 (-) Transcript_34385:347-658(-)
MPTAAFPLVGRLLGTAILGGHGVRGGCSATWAALRALVTEDPVGKRGRTAGVEVALPPLGSGKISLARTRVSWASDSRSIVPTASLYMCTTSDGRKARANGDR